jgi:signal peptidase I
MKRKTVDEAARPTPKQIEYELLRMNRYREISKSVWSTLSTMIVIAAVVVLVLNLWLPVLQVQRSSMNPALQDGDIMFFTTLGKVRQGSIIAFHHGSQILIKRVIAVSGDWIDIKEDGAVYINDELLDEPYVSETGLGECTVILPLQINENQYFVMGDHRLTSLDSRNMEIGLVHQDQIIGKSLLRVWPLGIRASAAVAP